MNYQYFFKAPQGYIRKGFDLSFYSDRPQNPHGGLIHGWGPLAGGCDNPLVDMVFVFIHWWQTHTGPMQADFSNIHQQVDAIRKAGKKVYLYPHPGFPPAWSEIEVVNPNWGWINYFDSRSQELQLQWYELIAKEFGHDKRVQSIRMSTFDHGETWVHPPLKDWLDQKAESEGKTSAEYAKPFVLEIFKTFLKYSDPSKLVAHGGGLQSDCLEWAIEKGTGHATGAQIMDFGGSNQYPRKKSRTLKNGHLNMKSIEEDGFKGLYFCERQVTNGWSSPEHRMQWIYGYLANLSSVIVHRTNYLMLGEVIYNNISYQRYSERSYDNFISGQSGDVVPVSPDTNGKLTRRGDESAMIWTADDEVVQMAIWAKSLLGTSCKNTPEAFVQLSKVFVAELSDYILAFEHAMEMDFDKSGAVATEEYDIGSGASFQHEILGFRPSYFAKRTNKAEGKDSMYFLLQKDFQKSLCGRWGELLEVRITYKEIGFGGFELLYKKKKNGIVSAGQIQMKSVNEWRTACFLLVDPDVNDDINFEIQLKSYGVNDLHISLVRVLKQYD